MRRLRAIRTFTAIAIAAAMLGLALGWPRRPPQGRASFPAGGAASTALDGDSETASDAIVEDARRYPILRWSFPLASYELRIEDARPGATALDAVLERTNGELAVNGGFFDPEGRPVGLAISEGAVLSKLKASLSGGVLVSNGDHAELFDTTGFVLPDGARFAVQCRPRLVVDRMPNVKSDDGQRAERTALCLRDGGHTLDVIVVRGDDTGDNRGPSLYALSRHLAANGCEAALNLDGGPSTGAAWREGGKMHLLAPRSAVRHVLIVVPR